MAERAKLLNNGGAQVVRLPRSCRFPEAHREVFAHRVGRKVILEPADEWAQEFISVLGAWPEEIARPFATKRESPS
jgi:virulence-associated protein VagC